MIKPPNPVLILGARSDIGRALAREYAGAGCALILAARNANDLTSDADDLRVRYEASVELAEFDVLDNDPDAFFAGLGQPVGTVIMVAGLLGDQEDSAARSEAADLVMRSNYNGPALFLLAAVRAMDRKSPGAIIGISSVAGDRGRASNFVYGSAKAGFTAFLSGLRQQLSKSNIQVMTVKPGFVATRMTAGMNLPGPLTAQPDAVAKAIVAAQRKGVDVLYAKKVWRPIMQIIRLMPEPIFKRLNF